MHITADTIPANATEARIVLEIEEMHAEWDRWAREELHAENGWLRAAEYDPEAWEVTYKEDMFTQQAQDRNDRIMYGGWDV